MDLKILIKLLEDKDLYLFDIVLDIKKLILLKLLKSKFIKIQPLKNEINEIYSSEDLLKLLWSKYVGIELPGYDNYNDLKNKYENVINLYSLPFEHITNMKCKIPNEYNIILKNTIILNTLFNDKYKFDYEAFNQLSYPYQKNIHGDNLLFVNSIIHDHNAIKLLMSNGFDINYTNNSGYSILTKAIMANNYSTVKFLLENGANPHIKDYCNNTLLIISIQHSNELNIIELLLNYGLGLNIYVKNDRGYDAFDIIKSKLDNYRGELSQSRVGRLICHPDLNGLYRKMSYCGSVINLLNKYKKDEPKSYIFQYLCELVGWV